jgi:hypothetical protein
MAALRKLVGQIKQTTIKREKTKILSTIFTIAKNDGYRKNK